MGVRHDDVRVSVRAVDILLVVPVRGVGRLRRAQSVLRCSVGPKSYVLELRLASVASERTAVVRSRAPGRASVASDGSAALPPRRAQLDGQLDGRGYPSHRPHVDGSRRVLPRRRLL